MVYEREKEGSETGSHHRTNKNLMARTTWAWTGFCKHFALRARGFTRGFATRWEPRISFGDVAQILTVMIDFVLLSLAICFDYIWLYSICGVLK